MDSKKLNPLGTGLCVLTIIGSIYLGRAINPFDASLPRVIFAAFIGGLGGGLGVMLSFMIPFTHRLTQEDE